ncbi:MAG TPA: TlpA disulfide reductase family protein [Egibacteraceae bacterium]|nr:TlpA disulfide reductase family protein [Egibacteraceae bacterium]
MGRAMRHLSLCLLLAVAVAACASAGGQESVSGRYVEGAGGVVFPTEEREPAPAVSGTTLEGEKLELADLEGPVLVNFWASWCGPCVREAPHLAAIAEQYADRGLHVVGVNVKDSSLVNARNFEREHAIPYPSWHDEAATIAAAFGGIGPAALPSTILLDAEHRVAVRLFGAVTARQLAPHLDELLVPEGAGRG